MIAPRDSRPASLNRSFIDFIKATRLGMWLGAAVVLWFFQILVTYALLKPKNLTVRGSTHDILLMLAEVYIIAAGVVAILSARGKSLPLRQVFLGKLSWFSAIAVGMLGMITLAPWVLALLLNTILRTTIPLMVRPWPFGVSAVGIVLVVVLTPLAEELLFRGWLQSRLQERWGIWGALLAGGLFAAAHGASGLSIVPFVIVVTWMRYRYGSLLATVVAHMTNNGLLVLLFFLAGKRL